MVQYWIFLSWNIQSPKLWKHPAHLCGSRGRWPTMSLGQSLQAFTTVWCKSWLRLWRHLLYPQSVATLAAGLWTEVLVKLETLQLAFWSAGGSSPAFSLAHSKMLLGRITFSRCHKTFLYSRVLRINKFRSCVTNYRLVLCFQCIKFSGKSAR